MLKKKKAKLGRKPKAEELKLKKRIGVNLTATEYEDLLQYKTDTQTDEDSDAVRKLLRQALAMFGKSKDKT